MLELITAGETMIPLAQYPHVYDSCSLRNAIDNMKRYQITNRDGSKSAPRVLLVFDKDEQLVGILRRRDIMRGLEPRFLSGGPVDYPKKLFKVKIDPNLSELSYDKFIIGIGRRAERRISEIMIPVPVTINADDHLMKAINEMVEYNCSMIPVLDEGKVVGIIRSIDVLHEISKLLEIAGNSNK